MRKKALKRSISLLIACILCVAMSVCAFAAEVDNPSEKEIVSYSRDLLYSKGKSINVSTSFTITTEEVNWNADFYVGVIGNTGVTYYVTMTTPNNISYQATVVGDGGLVKIAHFYNLFESECKSSTLFSIYPLVVFKL